MKHSKALNTLKTNQWTVKEIVTNISTTTDIDMEKALSHHPEVALFEYKDFDTARFDGQHATTAYAIFDANDNIIYESKKAEKIVEYLENA